MFPQILRISSSKDLARGSDWGCIAVRAHINISVFDKALEGIDFYGVWYAGNVTDQKCVRYGNAMWAFMPPGICDSASWVLWVSHHLVFESQFSARLVSVSRKELATVCSLATRTWRGYARCRTVSCFAYLYTFS